jgi:Glycosyl transferases group 1
MIGIHKLGFDTLPKEKKDTNGMFTEVGLLLQLFHDAGLKAEYVDTTELFDKSYDNIFVFNGYENSTSNLQQLRVMTNELNYILTDTRFYDGRKGNPLVDNYFVQGPIKMYDKPTYNSYLHKLPIYESTFHGYTGHNDDGMVIWGGSVRERESKILEYVFRPHTNYFLNWDTLGIDTRVPIENYREKLQDSSYGIVLINPKDVAIGSITWRYYEYIANGVLTFIDYESDPEGLIIPNGSYMKIKSYKEMLEKMKYLSNSEALRGLVREIQDDMISDDDLSGHTFIKSLLESREANVR